MSQNNSKSLKLTVRRLRTSLKAGNPPACAPDTCGTWISTVLVPPAPHPPAPGNCTQGWTYVP